MSERPRDAAHKVAKDSAVDGAHTVANESLVQVGGYGAIPAMQAVWARWFTDPINADKLRRWRRDHGDILATEPGVVWRRLPGGDAMARREDYEARSCAACQQNSFAAWGRMVKDRIRAGEYRQTATMRAARAAKRAAKAAKRWTTDVSASSSPAPQGSHFGETNPIATPPPDLAADLRTLRRSRTGRLCR